MDGEELAPQKIWHRVRRNHVVKGKGGNKKGASKSSKPETLARTHTHSHTHTYKHKKSE